MILKTAFQLVSSFSMREKYRKRKDRRDPSNPVPHLLQAQPALTVLLSKSVLKARAPSPNPTTLNEWTSNVIFNNGDIRREPVIPVSSPMLQLRFYANWMLPENST